MGDDFHLNLERRNIFAAPAFRLGAAEVFRAVSAEEFFGKTRTSLPSAAKN